MAKKIYLKSAFCYREDTLKNWQKENPVLKKGEVSIVRDGKDGCWLKIGDGETRWNLLEYKMGPVGPKGQDGVNAITDENYSPTSVNAQSGKAVCEAIDTVTPNDIELIAQGELAAAANEIKITLDTNGNPLNVQDIISFYFYSPKNENGTQTCIKLNNRLVTQMLTMARAEETYSKAISLFNGYEWETLFTQAAPAGNGVVNMRGITPFRTESTNVKTVSSIVLYCYNKEEAMPAGFKYKIYARRAK